MHNITMFGCNENKQNKGEKPKQKLFSFIGKRKNVFTRFSTPDLLGVWQLVIELRQFQISDWKTAAEQSLETTAIRGVDKILICGGAKMMFTRISKRFKIFSKFTSVL